MFAISSIAVRRPALSHAAEAAQRGVSLIEVLVAIVLLSIGLLGLAGLQLRGMQVNQGSISRSQAAIMAEDLADRMRADAAVGAGVSPPTNAPTAFYGAYTPGSSLSALPPSMQDWFAAFKTLPAGAIAAGGVSAGATAVPGGCGNALPCVSISAAAATLPTPVKISIYWNDARASTGAIANDTNQVGSYTMVAELAAQ
jgi:type IV pilus assembly protein PilV